MKAASQRACGQFILTRVPGVTRIDVVNSAVREYKTLQSESAVFSELGSAGSRALVFTHAYVTDFPWHWGG